MDVFCEKFIVPEAFRWLVVVVLEDVLFDELDQGVVVRRCILFALVTLTCKSQKKLKKLEATQGTLWSDPEKLGFVHALLLHLVFFLDVDVFSISGNYLSVNVRARQLLGVEHLALFGELGEVEPAY